MRVCQTSLSDYFIDGKTQINYILQPPEHVIEFICVRADVARLLKAILEDQALLLDKL